MEVGVPLTLFCLIEVKWMTARQSQIVLPFVTRDAKTILVVLSKLLPRQSWIVSPRMGMAVRQFSLSYRISLCLTAVWYYLVDNLRLSYLVMDCLSQAYFVFPFDYFVLLMFVLSFLLVFVLSFICLTSTNGCLYIWHSILHFKCSSL